MRQIIVATALLALAGTAHAQDDPLDITLLNAFVADEFWQGCTVGATKAAEEVGATLTELDGNNQAQAQANQIDVTLQRAPDAILIAALDSNAVVPQLTRAMKAGIDTYAFNTAVPNATLTATVAMDETATGAAAAERIVELLRAKSEATGETEFNLVHLVGNVATEPVRLRRAGFNEAIEKPVEGLTITMSEVITNWQPEMAVTGMQDAITRGPVDAIFTESDFLTPFLIPVLQRAGYTPADGDNPIIIGGLGGIPGGLKAIRDGWQDFTLNYPIDGMCSSSVYLAAASHEGTPFEEAWQDAAARAGLEGNAPRMVESEASGPSILLTANPIDADNVDDDAFWANTFRER